MRGSRYRPAPRTRRAGRWTSGREVVDRGLRVVRDVRGAVPEPKKWPASTMAFTIAMASTMGRARNSATCAITPVVAAEDVVAHDDLAHHALPLAIVVEFAVGVEVRGAA